MKIISTTIQKLNKDYKPLGVAVFLAIGGLLSGVLWSSLFASHPAGVVQVRMDSGSSGLISQAEGAEVDSAALTPQSAPFLASTNADAATLHLAENVDMLYNEGALKDPEQAIKTKTTAPVNGIAASLALGVTYKVAAGDTLASIAAAFDVPMNTIVEFNPSVNFSTLAPGTSITIPNPENSGAFTG